MIAIYKDYDKNMKVKVEGNAEEVAQELAAVTTYIIEKYPAIYDRVAWYLQGKRIINVEEHND